MGVMSRETAGALIEAAFAAADEHGAVSFAFQGGEPTVAGLDFFRDFVAMVSAFRPLDRQVSYALQTNGMALNEEWTHFKGKPVSGGPLCGRVSGAARPLPRGHKRGRHIRACG